MTNTDPDSPYKGLPPQAFWRSAVVERQAEAIATLHQPRFALSEKTAIMTAGSCFAQHLHRRLSRTGWNVITKEDVAGLMHDRVAARYGYGQFSARYGNIYTARQWVELIGEALSEALVPPIIWPKEGRFVDALRPSVEPTGLASEAEVIQAREAHIRAVRMALFEADCVIFTLGLTESWLDRASGRCLPTAPGTVAGSMAQTPADFVNFGYDDVLRDLERARDMLRGMNPDIRLLFTVSPVPLTATATGTHIAQASTVSKAILRAAVDAMLRTHDDVDYFPSYEIITTPVLGGPFFAQNLRSPSDEGVETVMRVFEMSYGKGDAVRPTPEPDHVQSELDVACEDMLLDTFAR